MENLRFFLDGTEINPPQNYQELSIELNFDKDNIQNKGVVSINSWDFVRENNEILEKWLSDGNLFEGLPFQIKEKNTLLLNAYLDITDNAVLSCIKSTITAKERGGVDWLNDVAEGFSMEYLARVTHELSVNDNVYVPYVLNSIPNYKEAFLCVLTVFMVSTQLDFVITKLSEMSAEATNPFEATVIIRAIIYIAYLVVLLASLVKLVYDLINYIIQPVKYHVGMRVLRQLQAGARHLGLTFKSSFLELAPYNDMVIIPEKNFIPTNPDNKNILGFTKPAQIDNGGYFKGTYGDLLRAMKEIFNCKIVMLGDGVLRLEKMDYNVGTPQFQLGDFYITSRKINASEIKSNYLIEFEVDTTEKNTIQEYQGTTFQVILKPIHFNNKDLLLLKGLEQRQIPFALAKTKTELTGPEEIVKFFLNAFDVLVNAIISAINVLIDVVNAIIDVLNDIIDALDFVGIDLGFKIDPVKNIASVSIADIIGERIGMLKIENDNFTRPKIVILDIAEDPFNTKISESNKLLTAKHLYENFHYVNSYFPSVKKPNGNQCEIKSYQNIPFCLQEFSKVIKNSYIYDHKGNEAQLSSVEWFPFKQTANITARFPKLLTSNLVEHKIEPDGK